MRSWNSSSVPPLGTRDGGCTVWLTELPATYKTTQAGALAAGLRQRGARVVTFDGDELRVGPCSDLHRLQHENPPAQ
ncbi:MAG: adenylyl-sulfate kinase [Coriobacteriia bacterium]|nr:adenylyl-sulfate kinase [Pseudomonadota bacterium]MDZ4178352.1 adenylyl-sulfate kinase [Coriobacteriia bacterium]